MRLRMKRDDAPGRFVRRHPVLHRFAHSTWCRIAGLTFDKRRAVSSGGTTIILPGGVSQSFLVIAPGGPTGLKPVSGADITMNGKTEPTNQNGGATFEDLIANKAYSFTVTASGYQKTSGSFPSGYVGQGKIFTVTLSPELVPTVSPTLSQLQQGLATVRAQGPVTSYDQLSRDLLKVLAPEGVNAVGVGGPPGSASTFGAPGGTWVLANDVVIQYVPAGGDVNAAIAGVQRAFPRDTVTTRAA